MKHNMIYTENLLKYLHCLLITGEDLGLKPNPIEQGRFDCR